MKNLKLFLIAMTFIPGWAGVVPANALPPCGLNSSALLCDRSTIPQKPEGQKPLINLPTMQSDAYICPENYPAMNARCTELNFQQGNSWMPPCGNYRFYNQVNNLFPAGRVHDAVACQAAQRGDTQKMYEKAAEAYDAILDKQGGQAAYQYMEFRSGFGFFDFLIKRR